MANKHSEFIVIIRPEFMAFCNDACGAASFNHLLFRIAGKCKDKPKEQIQAGKILWYGTTELIREEMAHAWGECKIRQEVNELVDIGIIGRTKDPNWGVNRTKHFFFGQEQCAKFLELCEKHHICFVHLDLPDEVKHLIYSSNANDKSIKCICANDKSIECKQSNHQMQAIDTSNASDKSIEAITKKTTKNNTKEDNEERESSEKHTIVSSDTAHASLPSKDEIPVTFADCLSYLQEQGVAPRGEDAVEVMTQARTLYAHKHPRYAYRARPGLSEHPDDQLPSQDEQLFRNDAQGDDHEPIIDTASHSLHSPSRDLGTAGSQGYPQSTKTLEASDEGDRAPDRQDVPLTKKGQTDGNTADRDNLSARIHDSLPGGNTPKASGDTHRVAPSQCQEEIAQTPPTSTPAQSPPLLQTEQAALGARTRTRKPAEPKPETRSNPPVEPPSDMAWGTRKCLMWFDYWRGGILIGAYKNSQASTCAKGLAAQFDEQTVIEVRELMEADPYYAAKGGCDVCDVAHNIHKYIKRHRQQQSKPKPVQAPNPNQPITNIRELVKQREALRAAATVGV